MLKSVHDRGLWLFVGYGTVLPDSVVVVDGETQRVLGSLCE